MKFRAIGVVVPANDEESFLPGCLAAVRRAAAASGVECGVRIVVVADACQDRTAERALEAGAEVIRVDLRSAGAARRLGLDHVVRGAAVPLGELWLATTDADSLVPPDWLSTQLRLAREGWEAVVGTVVVTDWEASQAELATRFRDRYGLSRDDHPHVHGANLGVSASAYVRAGGFPPVAVAEDHALVNALRSCGVAVARPGGLPVATSGRIVGRAAGGFADMLKSLAAGTTA